MVATYSRLASELGSGLAIAGLVMMVGASILVSLVPAAGAATREVNISNLSFDPPTIIINVGDSIRWTNNDSREHTVTSDTGAWAELDLLPSAQGSVPFDTIGSYDYHCRFHPSMTGTVVVQNAVPEFSDGLIVVIGLVGAMLGVMFFRRRRAR